MTSEYVKQLMIKISQDCNNSFNETALFRKNDFQQNLLLREIQDKFYNISRIFDCIGCDKCRLNGKVQITGLGAAMKILFQSRKQLDQQTYKLHKIEIIGLINLLDKLSESLEYYGMYIEIEKN